MKSTAPPGYPNTYSTPSSCKQRMTISAPVRVVPVPASGGSWSSMLRPCKSRVFRGRTKDISGWPPIGQAKIAAQEHGKRAGGAKRVCYHSAQACAPCPRTGEKTGHPEGAVRLPRLRGAARVQAERVRGARRRGGARYRPGRDDEARREVLDAASGGIAAALPAHPAECDPRPLPAPEGPQHLDHPAFQPRHGRRRWRLRPARNPRCRYAFQRAGFPGRAARAIAGDVRHRGSGKGAPAASTRGFHVALLGGTRCERNGQGDGMLGRQRENALLPGNSRFGESPEIKRDNAMNEKEFAAKLKPWLERSAASVGEMQATKLKSARLRPLDPFRQPLPFFGLLTVPASTAQTIQYSVVQRNLLWVPVALLVAFLVFQSARETDLGELDAQLLTQELPPDAFLDQDFRAWLGKSQY